MHLRSVTMKGFKSFPDRTRLEFGSGVSVVVGPNGSGKSNVTDAVLWAMGEQSPLAVRGQSMQDVIFGGGRGVQARPVAEVEIVLDNEDATLDVPLSEISILRRLDRAGEGEYRLNGARCRLTDVLEVLSDTGLGQESHSVVSQGRVEAIVTSKARDRRLLIEEAAGLGKHRKRRRRAQLKLQRTQENLDRALDVEREARSRLRPLKRQAEAAELHERLERQALEVGWELARDALRARRADLVEAQAAAAGARTQLDALEAARDGVAGRREQAERALGARSEQRDRLARRGFRTRSALERVEMRRERAAATATALDHRVGRGDAELQRLRADADADAVKAPAEARVAALSAELEQLGRDREQRLERELGDLRRAHEEAVGRVAQREAVVASASERLAEADVESDATRRGLREAEREVEASRRLAAAVGAELSACHQFLRSHAIAARGAQSLGAELRVKPGYELALAAALDGRLSAAVVPDRATGERLLDEAGADGGRALIVASAAAEPRIASESPAAPVLGARRLVELVDAPPVALALARALLSEAWVVASLAEVPSDFQGIAVTVEGRAWLGGARELRQVAAGGEERLLAQRNHRDALIADSERAVAREHGARTGAEHAARVAAEADAARDGAERARREAQRARAEAVEEAHRTAWLIDQRRRAPDEGPSAVRRAQLEGQLDAERAAAERATREQRLLAARTQALARQLELDRVLAPAARRLTEALGGLVTVLEARAQTLDAGLAADRQAGEHLAQELRSCAGQEAEIQGRLRGHSETVTAAEVGAQRARDRVAEVHSELERLAAGLGLSALPAAEALDEQERATLTGRLERLRHRREQLGPVNPLAQDEYSEALDHVETLESQRNDSESAVRELGSLIRDTDRQIRETFEATFTAVAANFEELVGEVFPGGRGRLRLVSEDSGPRPVLGGQPPSAAESENAAEAESDAQGGAPSAEELLGVEIEVTPAGKSMKRLSLLSGGEKSMTALAFLFAVFLARPCPFYILDEVEAALDDLNIDRFLALLRRHSGRAQFIVVTHQKRTMEAADCLYGVSMGDDGVSRVISRRLPADAAGDDDRSRGPDRLAGPAALHVGAA